MVGAAHHGSPLASMMARTVDRTGRRPPSRLVRCARAAEKAKREAERGPRPPRSAYQYYANEHRRGVGAANPSLDGAAVAALLLRLDAPWLRELIVRALQLWQALERQQLQQPDDALAQDLEDEEALKGHAVRERDGVADNLAIELDAARLARRQRHA